MMNPLLTGRLAIKRLYDHEMAPLMARFTLTRMELDVLRTGDILPHARILTCNVLWGINQLAGG